MNRHLASWAESCYWVAWSVGVEAVEVVLGVYAGWVAVVIALGALDVVPGVFELMLTIAPAWAWSATAGLLSTLSGFGLWQAYRERQRGELTNGSRPWRVAILSAHVGWLVFLGWIIANGVGTPFNMGAHGPLSLLAMWAAMRLMARPVNGPTAGAWRHRAK